MEQRMKRDIDKNDALMTSGLAILTMLVLHLFCRTGDKVYGTPLCWLDKETPLVYWFGFFAEICVTLYALRGGYAVYLQGEGDKIDFKSRALRVLKLMETYWIVDVLFCIIGLIAGNSDNIPGSLLKFIESIFLLSSYNGAWWYLTTYVIIVLFFAPILYKLAKKTNFYIGMVICTVLQFGVYFMGKFDLWPSADAGNFFVSWVITQFQNLWGPLISFFAGCLICKYKLVSKLRTILDEKINRTAQKFILLGLFAADFVLFNIVHKAIFVFVNAVIIFVMFNLWEKGKASRTIFMFLGKHSTAIWLSHMFFYLYVFTGLVQKAQYPVLMLLFMLALTTATSYIVIGVRAVIGKTIRLANGGNKKCLAEKK